MSLAITAGRSVRLFVSSTFQDMHAERDVLVRSAFPRLRRLSESAGTAFQEIDLRWGVTAEQSAAGEVIGICLDEIDACRPFFIAMIGGRYGWIDPHARERLAPRHAHLLPFAERSVTELEIRHAILNAPPHLSQVRPFIYVQQNIFRDLAAAPAPIAALVAELMRHGCSVRGYGDPIELDEMVVSDLRPVFEDMVSRTPLSSARRAQVAFATQLETPGFQRRRELGRLRRRLWLSRRIVVEGAEGAGKSSLLLALHRERRGSRFASLAPASARWPAAIEALVSPDAPADDGTSGEAWKDRLEALIRSCPEAVIIDGVGDDTTGPMETGLEWLPAARPLAALVVSTASGEIATALAARGFRRYAVRPLDDGDLRGMIDASLGGFGKKLGRRAISLIVGRLRERTPLHARTFLELLRQFGSHEALDEEIERLLAQPSTQALFDLALDRIEKLAGMPEQYVRNALRFLAAARVGLTETEMLELTGRDGRPALMRWWAPIRYALLPFMFDRGGVLSIAAKPLAQAIEARYETSDGLAGERWHLAHFFLARSAEARAIDELVYLLPAAGLWDEAIGLLSEPGWLVAAQARDPSGIDALCARVLEQGSHRADVLLRRLEQIAGTASDPSAAVVAAGLLVRSGRPSLAARSCERLLASLPARSGEHVAHEVRITLLDAQLQEGDLQRALATLASVDMKAAEASVHTPLIGIKERAGLLAMRLGEHDLARQLLDEARTAAARAGHGRRLLGRIDLHLVELMLLQGDHRRALSEVGPLERQARRQQDPDALAMALACRAMALRLMGHRRKALQALAEEEALWRVRGDNAALARCLVNEALCHLDGDDFDTADALLEKASAAADQGGDRQLQTDVRRRRLSLLDRLGLGNGRRSDDLRREITAIENDDRPT